MTARTHATTARRQIEASRQDIAAHERRDLRRAHAARAIAAADEVLAVAGELLTADYVSSVRKSLTTNREATTSRIRSDLEGQGVQVTPAIESLIREVLAEIEPRIGELFGERKDQPSPTLRLVPEIWALQLSVLFSSRVVDAYRPLHEDWVIPNQEAADVSGTSIARLIAHVQHVTTAIDDYIVEGDPVPVPGATAAD